MELKRVIDVPTGKIAVVEGEKGLLELVSLGDYGKDKNLKADFLGLAEAPERVVHQDMLPLEEKWVVTISTQHGCRMNCNFCDVPLAGNGRNCSLGDLVEQVDAGIALYPEVRATERLNIHFARMGEPTWNPYVLDAAMEFLNRYPWAKVVHPVVSTMMPKWNEWLRTFIHTWLRIKNHAYGGQAGLQLSINSTNEMEREIMFAKNAHTIEGIARVMDDIRLHKGRKITLNFAVAGYEIDPDILLKYFDPSAYLIKLTPMHKTATAIKYGIETCGDYTEFHPYELDEARLRAAGYDVLVFIASKAEDEGRITCGNAVLSGNMPFGAGLIEP